MCDVCELHFIGDSIDTFLIVLIVLGETSNKLEKDKQNERIVPFLQYFLISYHILL